MCKKVGTHEGPGGGVGGGDGTWVPVPCVPLASQSPYPIIVDHTRELYINLCLIILLK